MLHLTESPFYLQTFVRALQYFQIFHVVSELGKVELTHHHLRDRFPMVPVKGTQLIALELSAGNDHYLMCKCDQKHFSAQ